METSADQTINQLSQELATLREQLASLEASEVQRRRAEAALEESERLARSTLDGLSDHIAIIDQTGTILAVNKAWREFAGANLSIESNVHEGANYLEVCDRATGPWSEEAASFAEAIRAVLAGEREHFEQEYPCHSPDEERWFVGRVTRFPDVGLPRAVVAHQNISDRKKADQALRHAYEQLDATLNALPDMMFVMDREGRFLDYRTPHKSLLYLQPEAFQGKTAREVMPQEVADLAMDTIRKAAQEGRASGQAYQLEMPDGPRWYEWSISAQGNPQAPDARFITLVRDITERVETEKALQQYAERLETLRQIDRAILAAQSPAEIAKAALSRIRQLLACERASVTLYDFERLRATILTADTDYGETLLPAGVQIPLADFPDLSKLGEGIPLIVSDITLVPKPVANERRLVEEGMRSYALIPLNAGGALIGALNVAASRLNAFRTDDIAMALGIADSLAIAVQQAQLREQIQHRAAELEAVRQASLFLTASLKLEEVLDAILKSTFTLLNDVSNAHIYLHHEEHLSFGAGRWFDNRAREMLPEPRPHGLTYSVARRGEPMVVTDLEAHPLFADADPDWKGALVGMPLKIGQRVVGVMNVGYAEPREFTEAELRVMRVLGDQAAIAIENARLYATIQRRHQYLATLRRVSRRSVPERNLQRFMQAVVEALVEEFDYSVASIMLGDDSTRQLRLAAVAGPYTEALAVHSNYQQAYDAGVIGWVMRHGQARLLRDTSADSDYLTTSEELKLGSELAVPIHQLGKVIGVLNVEKLERNTIDELDLEAMSELADELALRLENVTLYEQAERHAEELEQRVAERTSELNEANKHLQTLSRLKDEFVANVSHELRTPIASLKLYHDLLTARPQKAEAYLQTLQRETSRLQRIVEDLLQLSRMDQDQVEMRPEAIDLNELVSLYVADRPLLAESRGLTLRLETQPRLPRVQADEGLIGQAVSILLTNALNYTANGGEVVVRTGKLKAGGKTWIGFSVSDTGPGIAPQEKGELFQRFFRGRAAQESGIPGTGLGLAIVKEIVDRHKGRVEVDSAGVPGEGSTFSVWLPLQGREKGA